MTPAGGYVKLYVTRAHVFQINAETKSSWVSNINAAIPITIYMRDPGLVDPTQAMGELRIVGEAESGERALDCVINTDTIFNKRSQKFVQWPDVTGMVYGLGFSSECDLNDFIETFEDLKRRISSNTFDINTWFFNRNQANLQGVGNQQGANMSEIKGRHTIDHLTDNSGRASSTNMMVHHTNQAIQGVVRSSELTNSNSGSIRNGELNENQVRYPPRSQSSTGLQVNKPGMVSNNGNSSIGQANRLSPDADENLSVQSDHQIREQLKYENERLKQALEESTKNASLWHTESQNLRTNNIKLTQALQESKSHVEDWEKELLSLRDENKELKLRVMALESMSDSSKSEEYKVELQKYKNYVDEMQSELRSKENEVEDLQRAMEQMEIKANAANQNGDLNSNNVLADNTGLKQKLDIMSAKLESKTNELANIQKELAQIVDKLH